MGKRILSYFLSILLIVGLLPAAALSTAEPVAAAALSNEQIIWNFFKGKGFSDAGTAGIMANLYAESNYEPTNLENAANSRSGMTDAQFTAAVNNGSISRAEFISSQKFGLYTYGNYRTYGYGLAQWTFYSRKQNLYDYWKSYGCSSIGDMNMQLNFIIKEMSSSLKNTMTSATDAGNACLIFHNQYEGSNDSAAQIQNRINKAVSILNTYGKTGSNPQGCLDSVTSDYPGTIRIRGWAFDRDCLGTALKVHVYIGGPAGSGAPGYEITADKSRPDVNNVFPGVGKNHGFDSQISVSKKGSQKVYVYAINVGGGTTNPQIGVKEVSIKTDTTPPTISNIKVTNQTRGGYTVTVTATDNVGVTNVKFPTWTAANSQDDLKWASGTKINATTWSYQVKASDHNMEGGRYYTHVYAYDAAGNSKCVFVPDVILPDYTENGEVSVEEKKEMYIVNSWSNNYLYQTDKTIYGNDHWTLTSGKLDEKNKDRYTWTFKKQSDGYYTIYNKATGKGLDVANYSKDAGTNVILSALSEQNPGVNKRWKIYKRGDALYLSSKCTPYTVMDIQNGAGGANCYMHYYDRNNGNQQFKLVPREDHCEVKSVDTKIKDSSPKTITLSKTSYTYSAKTQKPSVTVKGSDGKVIAPSNYTLTYSKDCKNIGRKSVKITFKGKYSGSETRYFNIVPKGTNFTKLTATSRGFTAKWSKQTSLTTGYELMYSTNSNFSGAKTIVISKNSTVSRKVTGLSAKKKYYVKVRAYKVIGKTKVYSWWSQAKTVTTK